MAHTVQKALNEGGIIDITTQGRKTGLDRRIEIVFHNLDGRLFIAGQPGPRDWYANILADTRFTVHLKRGITAELAAIASPIPDGPNRGTLLYRIMTEGFLIPSDNAREQLPDWIAGARLIEFSIKT